MGSGLSSNHRSRSPRHQPPARVIGADGALREFPAAAASSLPASVADVLASGGNNTDRFFVCSSDALYFDADVLALRADELLRPGQIYFVLPAAMRGRPLSVADMAALAVRAAKAMAAGAARPRLGRGGGFSKLRVVPVREDGANEINEKLNQRTLGQFVTSLNSARNGKRLAVIARPPSRRALSTIEEDA